MVDIEPYQYQKVTNIKEHNDIVAKINEIVDVLNNSGADTLGPRISKLETDVSAIDSAVKIQYQDIASIKDKDQTQDTNIGTLDAQVKGITESLVSDINIIDGTTTGKFKVRLDREKAPSINSNDYDLQKATSIELVQGSGPSMLKAQITLSDGTNLISDDFLFTTEAIGTDVYISSFVFKNGNVAGTISADIGLSNGTTLEANNFVVPMDPSLLNTVQDLSTRLTAVEGGSVAGFKELEVQVNTNKNNIATLTTEIDNLDIQKADQSNPAQTIKADTTDLRTVKLRDSTDAVGSYLQFNANADKPIRMEYYNGTEVVDSGFVATVDSDGKPKNFSADGVVSLVVDDYNLTNTTVNFSGSGYAGFSTDWRNHDVIVISWGNYNHTVVDLTPFKTATDGSYSDHVIGVCTRSATVTKIAFFPLTTMAGKIGFYISATTVGTSMSVGGIIVDVASGLSLSKFDVNSFTYQYGDKK